VAVKELRNSDGSPVHPSLSLVIMEMVSAAENLTAPKGPEASGRWLRMATMDWLTAVSRAAEDDAPPDEGAAAIGALMTLWLWETGEAQMSTTLEEITQRSRTLSMSCVLETQRRFGLVNVTCKPDSIFADGPDAMLTIEMTPAGMVHSAACAEYMGRVDRSKWEDMATYRAGLEYASKALVAWAARGSSAAEAERRMREMAPLAREWARAHNPEPSPEPAP
jgi:hypothetical protein